MSDVRHGTQPEPSNERQPSLHRFRPPRLPPNGKARKCCYFACRKTTVTDPLCAEHRGLSWMRQMFGLEAL